MIKKKPEQILWFSDMLGCTIESSEQVESVFAMWHPCSDDPLFSGSEIRSLWTMIYNNTENCRSYIAADILRQLGIVGAELERFFPMSDLLVYPLMSATGDTVILTLSEEKGMRFHFSEKTSYADRCYFLQLLLSYCQEWETKISLQKRDKDNDPSPSEWWSSMSEAAILEEKLGPVRIGEIRL